MRFLLSFLTLVLLLGGLAFLADNFFHLNWGTKEWGKKVLGPQVEKSEGPQVHPQEVTEPSAPPEEPLSEEKARATTTAVRIEGKWYAYNPRNLYVIDGVPTYYDPGRKAKKVTDVTAKNVQPGQALETVERMAAEAPLTVYTPKGAAATMEGAKEAVRQAQEKNKALEHLSRE